MATSKNKPTKKRYSDKDLAFFDNLLDEKLKVANEQLAFYQSRISEETQDNNDIALNELTDSMPTFEIDRYIQLASRQRKLIKHLENAKLRIKNKVYGVCRITGELISKERLKAVPHATLSVKAKQKRK